MMYLRLYFWDLKENVENKGFKENKEIKDFKDRISKALAETRDEAEQKFKEQEGGL